MLAPMSDAWVKTETELTSWVGLGQPADCFFPDRLVLVVARAFDKKDGPRVEVAPASAPTTPGAVRSHIPYVHVSGPSPLARGPYAVSPESRYAFWVSLRENVGELSQFGVVGPPVSLPNQPVAAAVSDDGFLWVSFVDGRLLTRAPDGSQAIRADARRYAFMAGGPLGFCAGTTAGSPTPGLFVHDHGGALRADLKMTCGHFAFSGLELVALEANGPVWVHRLDLKQQRHQRTALARSVDVLAIDRRGRAALTCDEQRLYLVDLETGSEQGALFPHGKRPRLAAFDHHSGVAWVVTQDAERRWWLARVAPA
ncbi:MAG: hypothetical protein Q8S33_04985 [Myxococcales bacterium]|nr:hypothetical protein [Myxococcales bacterium]